MLRKQNNYIRSDKIPTIIVSLFAEPTTENINLCSALTEYAWVDLEQAKAYDLIDGIYEELEMLSHYLKEKEIPDWKKDK